CIARRSTTVLATDKARPNTKPVLMDQPSPHARAMPSSVALAICTIAPGIAMRPTDNRSSSEKWRPTPNIRRITPISASFVRQSLIGDVSGRERADEDAGDEIADERRKPQPLR